MYSNPDEDNYYAIPYMSFYRIENGKPVLLGNIIDDIQAKFDKNQNLYFTSFYLSKMYLFTYIGGAGRIKYDVHR